MPNADRPKRGRPRDATVDSRVREAAISVFAAQGWSGFSVEGVAKAAGVAKGSIYLRWSSAQELLLDAMRTNVRFVHDPDSGSLRTDLLSLARQLSAAYTADNGRAFLRVNIEGATIPGFEEYWDFQQEQMKVSRQILRRGVDRGELPADVRVTTLLDALSGGILVHSLTAPGQVLMSSTATDRILEELVDLVMGRLHAPIA